MKGVRWVALGLLAACGFDRQLKREEASETFADQAVKGALLYNATCSKCHGALGAGTDKAPRLIGLSKGALPLNPPDGARKRRGQFITVADVGRFALEKMPNDAPGSLDLVSYWRIIAFVMKANEVDLGLKHLDLKSAEEVKLPRDEELKTTSSR
ncbi:MAG: c-type cytochrome [Archangiaceae bacterium]|nr:c-type cytochrome [Archangiaceae bacterium]